MKIDKYLLAYRYSSRAYKYFLNITKKLQKYYKNIKMRKKYIQKRSFVI